jgi:hypothetical protein
MTSVSAERQETGVIKHINDAVKRNKNNSVTVIAEKTKIVGVIKAEKFTSRQDGVSEPYTDVVFRAVKVQIGDADKIKIVVGDKQIGGSNYYTYIGPIDVCSKYDPTKNELTLNGKITNTIKH